jgi:ribosomal RNA-processing protein 36
MPKRKQPPTDDRDDSASEPYSDELDISSPEVLDFGESGEIVYNSNRDKKREVEDGENADEEDEEGSEEVEGSEGSEGEWESEDEEAIDLEAEEEEDEDAEETVKERPIASVSFGLLAQAQESLEPKKRKRDKLDQGTEDKLKALRERLAELRGQNGLPAIKFHKDENEESGDRKAQKGAELERTLSKHAPAVKSSKRTVSRKRQVIEVPRNTARDPRFDPTSDVANEDKISKNYKFLDEYIDSEIVDIQTKLKAAKPSKNKNKKSKKSGPKLSEAEIEELKRELVRKESKKASKEAIEREREVRREHKKKEKELVKQGKKPYFLKDSEVKKQVLVKRFEGLSEGKREKVMDKKRRKIESKEMKNIPMDRRG